MQEPRARLDQGRESTSKGGQHRQQEVRQEDDRAGGCREGGGADSDASEQAGCLHLDGGAAPRGRSTGRAIDLIGSGLNRLHHPLDPRFHACQRPGCLAHPVTRRTSKNHHPAPHDRERPKDNERRAQPGGEAKSAEESHGGCQEKREQHRDRNRKQQAGRDAECGGQQDQEDPEQQHRRHGRAGKGPQPPCVVALGQDGRWNQCCPSVKFRPKES